MLDLSDLNLSVNQKKVFKIFSEISNIPRGSGNRVKIADYCENFAQNLKLKYIRDNENNVVIFKAATKGYENAEPVILQGHLDIVCQSTEDKVIDFLTEGLTIYRDGDFIKADGTTLGADNGIAVAYIMAILSANDIAHPPIEAVFTADEEIGLLGANALDTSVLKAKKMINLDSETDDVLTVSCAGGQDVVLKIPVIKKQTCGTKLYLGINGLMGGHSGVEIDKGRANANILMGKLLSVLNKECEFDIISINGGKKPNAIPNCCTAEICTNKPELILKWVDTAHILLGLSEIKENEPDFQIEIKKENDGEFECFDNQAKNNLLYLLTNAPNGVIKMSEEIEGLVETSLNLGILSTENSFICLHYALRSNKENELHLLTEEVLAKGKKARAENEVSGFYPPWEFKNDSPLRELYKKCYKEEIGSDIKVEAIHAGLECAVFSSTIKNLDCISVGPTMYEVHTPNEKLSISSTIKTFNLILKVLKESCKL